MRLIQYSSQYTNYYFKQLLNLELTSVSYLTSQRVKNILNNETALCNNGSEELPWLHTQALKAWLALQMGMTLELGQWREEKKKKKRKQSLKAPSA